MPFFYAEKIDVAKVSDTTGGDSSNADGKQKIY